MICKFLNKAETGFFIVLLFASNVCAQTFILPPDGVDVIGDIEYTSSHHDETLLDIARRHNIGYREITLANPGVDPWIPGEGTEILLPTRYILPLAPRSGIVLNVPEMRLYYYPEPAKGEQAVVVTYPVSIGRVDWQTPLGTTRIISKTANPKWYPPESIRKEHEEKGDPLPKVVPAGPDNPLGNYALRLDIPGYLIHGTNKPAGIGMQVTHGCIRLYPENIEFLYKKVKTGTKIHIVDQAYKAGWYGDRLYMEVHPALVDGKYVKSLNLTPMVRVLAKRTEKRTDYKLDWERARSIATEPRGIPMDIPPIQTVESKEKEPAPAP